MDSSVSSQDDFAYGYDRRYETEGGNLFKHMEEIKAVIEDDFVGSGIVAPYSNMDLGIVITGHDVSKAGAYTLEDSETSKKAWKLRSSFKVFSTSSRSVSRARSPFASGPQEDLDRMEMS